MRPTGSPEELEHRRLRALALLKEGLLPVEVARRVGVDRRSVRRWKRAARRRGEAGGHAQTPPQAPPPKLGPEHKRRLEALLLEGAQAAGFHTDLWTCPRVAELIERRFGVCYHVDHIGRLLPFLDCPPKKPARRALERDERAIRRWVKEVWPRVKKTLAAGARRWASSTRRDS